MREQFVGQEVAAGAVLPLLDELISRGHYPNTLLSPDELRTDGLRISWGQALIILDAAETHLTPLELEAIGGSALSTPRYRSRLNLARWLLTLEDAFRFMVFPHEVIDYGCIRAAVRTRPGDIQITALLEDGYEPSSAFFRVMIGAAKQLPRLMGVDDAHVDGRLSGRSMQYRISYSVKSVYFQKIRARLSRWLRTTYCAFHMDNAYQELIQRTIDLEAVTVARDRIQSALSLEQTEHARRMQHLAEVIVEYDDLNQIVYLSPNAERLFGYSVATLRENPFIILPAEDRRLAEMFFENPQQTNSGVYPISAVHASGKVMEIEVAISHFVDQNLRDRWIATLRDVSSRRLEGTALRSKVEQQERRKAHEVDSIVGASARTHTAASPDTSHRESASVDAQTLLLADDDQRTQRIGRKILEHAGYRVVCVEDGTGVLPELAESQVSGILLDVEMPNMGGIEVYRELLQVDPKMPVVFVSGDPGRLRSEFPSAPVVGKPFRAEDLLAAVREAVAA